MHSESTSLFSLNDSGIFAGCVAAPAVLTKISAKKLSKMTTKTV
ncbi:hypothetical protein PMI41_03764 [Phyllobacterium sp. YR531]|nr:hypothetical protein PMI41_03764 [Phyllobacterium sp. YR531]